MTMPKGKELSQNEIDSIKIALKDCDIRAIHPDKMEAFAEHLVKTLSNSNEQN